jgi:hypothetical protein
MMASALFSGSGTYSKGHLLKNSIMLSFSMRSKKAQILPNKVQVIIALAKGPLSRGRDYFFFAQHNQSSLFFLIFNLTSSIEFFNFKI